MECIVIVNIQSYVAHCRTEGCARLLSCHVIIAQQYICIEDGR
jgi:hypothetical protein